MKHFAIRCAVLVLAAATGAASRVGGPPRMPPGERAPVGTSLFTWRVPSDRSLDHPLAGVLLAPLEAVEMGPTRGGGKQTRRCRTWPPLEPGSKGMIGR